MRNRLKRLLDITLVLTILLLFAGCGKEPAIVDVPDDADVKLRMLVNTPGITRPGTRAVAESDIDYVTVMVFEYDGTDYIYRYIVPGYSLTAAGAADDYDYGFYARLVPSTVDTRLWIIANGGSATNAATAGMTEDEVKEAVTMAYTSGGFTDLLPMTGSVDFTGGLTVDTTVDAVLVRSAAKVDITNSAANFNLTSVRVYRAGDRLQLIPDELTGNAVTEPSIPAGTTRSVNTGTFTVTGQSISDQIYIPESDVPAPGDFRLTATCVVVGGRFDGSSATTYYRMDFDPDDDIAQARLGQVLRNHRYVFNIGEVLAPGWSTDDQASIYPSTSIEVEIQVWDEETVYTVFDDYDHFGVSRRSVRLGYAAGADAPILVDTSLDTYTAYWSDADGNIIDADTFITPGGDFDDPDGLFNAAISAAGDQIVFSALASYNPDTAGEKYLLIVAGRMRIVLSVTQGAPIYGDRPVSIFGANREIGRFGLYSITAGWGDFPGERAQGLGVMLNGPASNIGSQNFGPGMAVDMRGFNVSGLNSLSTTMPSYYYEPFDVLYLTYANYVDTQAEVNQILAWLASDEHRVLIVQFDSPTTNALVMATLGFPAASRVYTQSLAAYSFAGNTVVPDFVRTGAFGSTPDTFSHKCRDATYGSVNPATADALGYLPVYLSNSTTSAGYYAIAVNPELRIIICGDCDFYSNNSDGTAGYYLNLNVTSPEIDPANPAHVAMGNLWAWIADTVLREE